MLSEVQLLVASVVLSVLYSLVKPAAWPGAKKQALAVALAVLLAVGWTVWEIVQGGAAGPVAVVKALVLNAATVVGATQLWYRYVWEQVKAEGAERKVKALMLDRILRALNLPT